MSHKKRNTPGWQTEGIPNNTSETANLKGDSTSPDRPAVVIEPSAWLRVAAARRVRDINAALASQGIPADNNAVVVTPLGKPSAPGSRGDRSCDRCDRYVPEDTTFWLFQYALRGVLLFGGLCQACRDLEVVA